MVLHIVFIANYNCKEMWFFNEDHITEREIMVSYIVVHLFYKSIPFISNLEKTEISLKITKIRQITAASWLHLSEICMLRYVSSESLGLYLIKFFSLGFKMQLYSLIEKLTKFWKLTDNNE